MMKHSISVSNLKCGGCAATIRKAIGKLKGLDSLLIDVDTSVVSFDSDEATMESAKTRLRELGYPENGTVKGLEGVVTAAKSYASCVIGKLGTDTANSE
jgi:copper chaperone